MSIGNKDKKKGVPPLTDHRVEWDDLPDAVELMGPVSRADGEVMAEPTHCEGFACSLKSDACDTCTCGFGQDEEPDEVEVAADTYYLDGPLGAYDDERSLRVPLSRGELEEIEFQRYGRVRI